MSKIIKLTAENVKRLRAVEITPDGNLVVIGGRNGQGKSSLLDSIEMGLAGGRSYPAMPLRRGAEKGRIEIELDDLVIRRTLTPNGGGQLVVTTKDGVRQRAPQEILDKLMGRIGFDPLEFARGKPEAQAQTLKGLVGLDFKAQEAARQKAYDERTAVGRVADGLKGQIAATPFHSDAPAAEVSGADILAERSKAERANATNQQQRNALVELRSAYQTAATVAQSRHASVQSWHESIEQLKAQLANAETKLKEHQTAEAEAQKSAEAAKETGAKAAAEVAKLQDIDLTPFAARLRELEATNAKVRVNVSRAELTKRHRAQSDKYDALTRQIEDLDEARRKAIAGAKYPVHGLAFDTLGGVTLNGIPFAQASSAEQLKVSVAIGLALNPTLRVLLIRDGSLLDTESLAMVREMAQKAEAQVWLEAVTTDAGKCQVIIEDGMIAEPAAQPAKEGA